jgi:hypothetical protein
MNARARLHLNLASQPGRNRRLFRTAVGFLAALIAVFFLLAGSAWWNYGVKKRALHDETEETERLIHEARSEESRLAIQIQNAEKALGTKVEIINSIILRKMFSWTGLFADLEAALPDSSFVNSLTPNFADDSTLVLRFQAVSRDLDDLVRLVNNLTAGNFRGIQITSESRDLLGRILTEISLTYERTF